MYVASLVLAFAMANLLLQHSVGERTCIQYESEEQRDCVCGLTKYDVEEQCQDEHTYYEPTFTQGNLTCEFECLNGGTKFELAGGKTGCHCPNGPIPYMGLCCQIETYCGDTFFKATGEFSSPGFHRRKYPNNFRCVWKITTDPKRRIALSLKDNYFDVEEGTTMYNCNRDYIKVYDGPDKKGKLRGTYCGNGMRRFRTLYSRGRHMYIEFVSNSQVQGGGFQLQYRTYEQDQKCGPRKRYELPTGIITSPQYPLDYKRRDRCEYEIVMKPEHDLSLRVLEMNMPSNVNCTQGDRIVVYQKGRKRKEEIMRFCGEELYPVYHIRGASIVFLEFRSDHAMEGRFKLQYNQVPSVIS